MLSKKNIELIKQYEGFKSQSYKCGNENFWTIGYGTAYSYPSNGKKIEENDTITKEQAEYEIIVFYEKKIKPLIQKLNKQYEEEFNQQLTENQKTAIILLMYNIGTGTFMKSKCWKAILNNDKDVAMKNWDWGIKMNIKTTILKGLIKRRNHEIELFFNVKNYWN